MDIIYPNITHCYHLSDIASGQCHEVYPKDRLYKSPI